MVHGRLPCRGGISLAGITDGRSTDGRPAREIAGSGCSAEPRAVPEPPAVKAAVERVDGIAGSIRYDGRRSSVCGPTRTRRATRTSRCSQELTDLEELELQGKTITDAAVGYLVGLPALHHLSLERTSITDEEWRT